MIHPLFLKKERVSTTREDGQQKHSNANSNSSRKIRRNESKKKKNRRKKKEGEERKGKDENGFQGKHSHENTTDQLTNKVAM